MSATEKKWRKTGLLDGTLSNSLDAEILAQNLNECASLAIDEVPSGQREFTQLQDFKIETLLPVICSLFHQGVRVLNITSLYNDYSQFLVNNPPDINNPIDEVSYPELYRGYLNDNNLLTAMTENL